MAHSETPNRRSMTSKVCDGCKRTIFVNENGSLYEDVHRRQYHTIDRCLANQLHDVTVERDTAIRVMREYVELNGVEHDDPDCPEDDTCECPTIANWNAVLATYPLPTCGPPPSHAGREKETR